MPRQAATILAAVAALALTACGSAAPDPRGVDRGETLLSVSATGEAEARPDQAFFQVGMENFGATGEAASAANRTGMTALLAALKAAGVPDKDIQTRALSIERVEWGDRRGQYRASNIVAVTVRDLARADAAVTAATGAGANVMSGPDLRLSDPEAAANTAYAAAYANAKKRAEAYAAAAGMEIARVLTIRDGGGSQGGRYFDGAMGQAYLAEEPPPAIDPAPVIQPGETASTVSVQVDFALRPK
jgi:uncharacterized protein YggE